MLLSIWRCWRATSQNIKTISFRPYPWKYIANLHPCVVKQKTQKETAISNISFGEFSRYWMTVEVRQKLPSYHIFDFELEREKHRCGHWQTYLLHLWSSNLVSWRQKIDRRDKTGFIKRWPFMKWLTLAVSAEILLNIELIERLLAFTMKWTNHQDYFLIYKG